MDIIVSISGGDLVGAKLDDLAAKLADMSGANKTIGDTLVKYYGGVAFDNRGRSFGQPWPDLAASTDEEKSVLYPGAPMMVRTGEMRASFQATITPLSIKIGNTAPYFKYHQSSLARKKLPRRVMLGIDDAVEATVTSGYEAYIRTVVAV